MTSTTSSVAGAVPADRAPLDDVTVILLPAPGQTGLDDVVAVLTAVQQQTLAPRRVLVAGFDEEHEDADRVLRHPITTSQGIPLLLRPALGPDAARWEVVEDARRGLPVQPGHWLWFLAPDSRPAPRALAALVAAAGRSSRVGVVGPKLVDADDPRRLLSLGHHLTPAGRATDADAGLVDQGQHDLRQDVLGVALVGSMFSAAAYVTVRQLARTEHPLVIVFYFTLVSVIGSAPATFVDFVMPRGAEWVFLLLVGVAAQAGQVCLTRGLALEPAGRATAIGYLQVVFAAIWGALLFGEIPDGWVIAGATVIIGSTLVLARQRVRAAPAEAR